MGTTVLSFYVHFHCALGREKGLVKAKGLAPFSYPQFKTHWNKDSHKKSQLRSNKWTLFGGRGKSERISLKCSSHSNHGKRELGANRVDSFQDLLSPGTRERKKHSLREELTGANYGPLITFGENE